MRTTIDPAWVTGFIDGAGSFTFNRNGDRITPVFAVRARASGRSLLEALRSFFDDAGRIYSTNEQSACLYRVNRTRDLLRVVEHFDTHPLRGDKRDTFRVWREMVFLRATHHGRGAPESMEALAEQIAKTPKNP